MSDVIVGLLIITHSLVHSFVHSFTAYSNELSRADSFTLKCPVGSLAPCRVQSKVHWLEVFNNTQRRSRWSTRRRYHSGRDLRSAAATTL